jgi:hypothetical protein
MWAQRNSIPVFSNGKKEAEGWSFSELPFFKETKRRIERYVLM